MIAISSSVNLRFKKLPILKYKFARSARLKSSTSPPDIEKKSSSFISGSIYLKRAYGDDIQSVMEDPFMFSSMIENLPLEGSINWYRPQVDFLRSDTNVWKFENRLDDEFVEWLSDIIKVQLNFDKDIYYPKADDEGNKLKRTPELENTIRMMYKKDFEVLYQNM